MLKPTLLYRMAAVLSLFFAAGHTIGFLTYKPPTAAAVALRTAMDTTRFQVGHRWHSFGDIYIGFGLYVGASMLAVAALAVWLGQCARQDAAVTVVPAAILALFELSGLGISWRFFSAPPIIISGLIALCLLVAIWSARRPA